jgi:PKD repeat protein
MSMRNGSILTTIFFAVALSSCGGGGGGAAPAPPVNSAPNASITVTKTTGYAPLTVAFDGASSSDRDGSVSTYTWHTGDGDSYAGSQVTHTYTTLGSFSATLTVTDDDGASSSTSVTIDAHAQAAGYYYGDITSNVTGQQNYVEVQIGSDHRVYGYQRDSWSGTWDTTGVYNGTVDVIGDAASATVLAETRGAYIFPDGSQLGNIDFDTTIDPKVEITGSYSGVGDNGDLILHYDDSLNQAKSLSDLEGGWSWSDGLGYTEILTVDAAGAFTYSDTDGCTFNGQFSLMDPVLNEFGFEYNLFTAQCPSTAGDGLRKGLAVISDIWYTDIWLEWKVTYMEGPMAGRMTFDALMRPRPVAAAGDLQKTEQVNIQEMSPQYPRTQLR